MILRTRDVARAVDIAILTVVERKESSVYYTRLYGILELLSRELSSALRKGQEYFDFETTDLPF